MMCVASSALLLAVPSLEPVGGQGSPFPLPFSLSLARSTLTLAPPWVQNKNDSL